MKHVLFAVTGPEDREQAAAWEWLARQQDLSAERVAAPGLHDRCDVAWLHAGAPLDPASPVLAALGGVRPRGALLLTGAAAALSPRVRAGAPAPAVHERTWQDETDELFFHDTFTEAPRLRGHAGFRAHPLFDGLHNGVFTWWPAPGESYCSALLPAAAAAEVGMIAAERAYIHVNADACTAWRVAGGAGAAPVLCIGAYLHFAPADPFFLAQTHRLARNALLHAADGGSAPADTFWPVRGTRARSDPAAPLPHVGADRPARISFATAPLRMAGGDGADPFTLAGRRALAAGTEGTGLEELWVHPLRALRALRLRDAEPIASEITALGIERTLRVGAATVDERTMVPHELGALVLEWDASAELVLRFEWEMDLRLMWPYPAGALGNLRWRTEAGTLVLCTEQGPDLVCCHFSVPPERWHVAELTRAPEAAGTAAPAIAVRADVRLRAGASLRLVVAASSSGRDDLEATLAALRDPISLARARTATLRRLQRDAFSLVSPEPRLDAAVEWAKYRLDSYLVSTPGVGRSLVAGYWHSSPGWGDGRPGYGWYFGRDAVWTALASLALGDFEAARDVIRFLGEKQDLSGKVLHECTTSGLVHYDAADATPLYLLLVARYHAWTGETGFLNGEWERVQRALRFCIGTDTDGDELIENPRVGHGWIEFGRLGGGKVTYYNAGIWTAALRELAVTAEDIGDRALASELHSRAKRARLALEARFFDAAERRYALKAWQEAETWRADYTPTATHAVPLLLGVADGARAARWLDDVAAEDFSAPWGVRMIPRSHELFNPRSYHGGAVWPLYTGWTSWAEYGAGRSESALRHLLANTALCFERGKGAWDEVLHGTELRAAGVCPDQAWSTALAVAPLVYGMLGAEPDAARNRLRLRPQLPPHWDRMEARGIRMADSAVTLRYERHLEHHHVFRLEQERGAAPVRVIFEPVLAGRALRHASVDGVPAALQPLPFAGRLLVPVQLVLDAERVVEVHTE